VRVVNVDNLMIRRYGRPKVATGRKLFHGMVRNNWRVCEFSDRDIAFYEAPLHIRALGERRANRRLIETCDNFRPDLIVVGHCDIIVNSTLDEIRRLLPAVRIAYRNVDPLWEEKNVARIRLRGEAVDAIFISTGGDPLRQFRTGRNVVAYMPNPADPAVEDQDNSQKTAFDRALVFCGVGNPTDDRYPFVARLHEALRGRLRFDTFGMHGQEAVWGRSYEDVLASSRMGLNLNRFEDWPLYSSARIAQLMGNGLLAFLWDKNNMRKFFTDRHVVFFSSFEDLVAKVLQFHADDARRQAVAAAGRAFYHEHFSGQRVASFIAETTLGLPYSQAYSWTDEVYR
jgi:hypothetical protein